MKNRIIALASVTQLLFCQNGATDNDVVFRDPVSGSGGAPATIATLAAGTITRTSIQLNWTAVGATANVGTASSYTMRYLTGGACPIDANNFDTGTTVTGLPAPSVSGSAQTVTVAGLTAGTAYCFGIKVNNAAGFTSALSNTVSATALPLYTALQVYGQMGSMTTATSNKGGRSENSIASPYEIATDSANGLYVVDSGNNRVLYFPSGSTTATRVYGQASFATGGSGVSATSLNGPRGVAVSPDGVYISDFNNNRVLYFAGTDTTATRVYGQPDFTTNTSNITASATNMFLPQGIAADSTGLYVAQPGFHRVVFFAGTSTTASRVYGQGGYTTSTSGSGAGNLNNPSGVALDSTGVYICDFGNNRIKYHAGTSTTATRFYGQATNSGSASGTSTTRFNDPVSIAVNTQGLYVADNANNRVVYFPHGTATTYDSVATLVYGQSGSFTSGGVNNGGITANSLSGPWGVATDANGVYVTDRGNHRILFY